LFFRFFVERDNDVLTVDEGKGKDMRKLATIIVLGLGVCVVGCQQSTQQATTDWSTDASWEDQYYFDEELYDSYAAMHDGSTDVGWTQWDQTHEYGWYNTPEAYWGQGEDSTYYEEYAYYDDLSSYYGEQQDYSYQGQPECYFREDEFSYYDQDQAGWQGQEYPWDEEDYSWDDEYSWYENQSNWDGQDSWEDNSWDDDQEYWQQDEYGTEVEGDEYVYYYDDTQYRYPEDGYWTSGWDD
jgi:hypothetical protein